MLDLFYRGGIEFMSLLSVFAISNIVIIIKKFIDVFNDKLSDIEKSKGLSYIKFFGTLSLVSGVFGQIIGLYSAMVAIEQMGNVSPAMLAGGIKVSFITTMYGFLIFILSYLLWFVLDLIVKLRQKS